MQELGQEREQEEPEQRGKMCIKSSDESNLKCKKVESKRKWLDCFMELQRCCGRMKAMQNNTEQGKNL